MIVGLLGGGALAGIFAALVAYLTSRREHGGRIDTSEAKILWDAQERFRESQTTRIAALETRVENLEEANRRCEEKLAAILKT